MKKKTNEAITLWLTGLSGSGKTTIAKIFCSFYSNFVLLDGDELRKGLCSDLGFSIEDRVENMRRLISLCTLLNNKGINIITSFISPIELEREKAKKEIKNCYVIFVDTDLEVCEERDVKGLYARARSGEIKEFTGIDSPFDYPYCADYIIKTENRDAITCSMELVELVKKICI